MNKKELLQLQQEIEDAKTEVSKLEGRKERLMEELQEKWACPTMEDAQKKLKELNEQVTKLNDQIEEGLEKLEEDEERSS